MRPSFFLEYAMNVISRTSKRPGKRASNNVLIIFMAFCMAFISMSAIPVNASETGIRGVMLWGPVRPGPTRLGQSDEAPLRATFVVFAGKRKVTQFKSDKMGKFEVLLPAGDYTIAPTTGTPMPSAQSQIKAVSVPTDGFAEVTLRFDTGMR